MTVISPDSRARAPHRRLTRRLVATGAAVAIALGLAAPAAAAPSPTPTPTQLSGEVALTLAPLSNGVVRAGQSLTVTLEVDNGTATATSAAPASLSLGSEPLADREALETWLTGDIDPALTEIAATELPAVLSGDDGGASLTLAAEDPALAGRGAGVYPLRAAASVGGDELTSRSVVIVPADGATAPVGIVVPITAGPLATGLLDSDRLAALTALDGDLTAQLGAVEGTDAILAVDPALAAAIRVLGSAAPPSALEWLERLERLPNSRFALQFGDSDLAVQLQAGLDQPLQPTSLLAYMDAANFAPSEDEPADDEPTATPSPTPTPTASPTPVPEGPVFPDLATLLSVGETTRPSTFWPATATAGPDVVSKLAPLGSPEVPALTLVSSTSTRAGEGGATVGARATAEGAELLVYDATVSRTLGAAAAVNDTSGRAALTTAATAHLAFATSEAGGRPLLVTVDRGEERSRPALRSAINAAAMAPGVAPASLEQVAAAPPAPTGLATVDADTARSADTMLLMGDEAAIDGFATVLDDPQLLTGPQRAEILQLLGVAWREDAEATAAAVATHRAATDETLGAVSILPSVEIILASYQSELPRTVRNDLPYPVNLSLVAQPDDPRLAVEERTAVTAQPASNTRVVIPVQSRVGNGTVSVAMQLYSPTGVPIGAAASTSVEVHADWESIGLGALITVMVLFIGLGVIRTVLARRARKRELESATLEPDARTGELQHPEERA